MLQSFVLTRGHHREVNDRVVVRHGARYIRIPARVSGGPLPLLVLSMVCVPGNDGSGPTSPADADGCLRLEHRRRIGIVTFVDWAPGIRSRHGVCIPGPAESVPALDAA